MQLQESDDYNIYSKDCIPDNRGGGIFQVMKKDIFVTHRDDLDTDPMMDPMMDPMSDSKQEIKIFIFHFFLSPKQERHR